MKKDAATAPLAALVPVASTEAALALPKGLEGAFTPEEWAGMSADDRASALTLWKEESQETTRGVVVTFPRIKYPTSGSSFWEIPTADGEPQAERTIEGIVVFKQPVRAYWPLGAEVSNNPPTCASRDGVVPDDMPGKQAKACAACPHAQWGSGKDGRGQACKARLNTFLLMEGQQIPYLVSLPPTALRTFGDFAVALRQRNVPLIGVTTVFSLTDEKSGGGIAYKGVALKIGRPLPFRETLAAKTMRDTFQEQMARRGITVDEAHEDEAAAAANGGAAAGAGQVVETTASTVSKADPKAGF